MVKCMQQNQTKTFSAPFWVVWGIEFWERFGFYGVQAIIVLYFVKHIGLSEKEAIYLMGSFSALMYGFVWLGGYLGDKIIGAKRSIILGSVILASSYMSFSIANESSLYYSLAGIIVGNAIFKANPSSLISKMFSKGDGRLDGAMTMYYMAVNIGSLVSMALTPVISDAYGYQYGFLVCSLGLLAGLVSFFLLYSKMDSVYTEAGKNPLDIKKFLITIAVSFSAFMIIANILDEIHVCLTITIFVVILATAYYLYIAFTSSSYERNRMLVALVLIVEAVVFFSMYSQQPTSLTLFAEHNIHMSIFGWEIPAAQYQMLNPFWIVALSPILAIFYAKTKYSHATKFCFGMVMMVASYTFLYATKYFADDGMVSGGWLVASYAASSLGELLISGLGLAMVAELCPAAISGFVMGFWYITNMVSSYLAAWIGSFIAAPDDVVLTAQQSLDTYTDVFGKIAIVVTIITVFMFILVPILNKYIKSVDVLEDHKIDPSV